MKKKYLKPFILSILIGLLINHIKASPEHPINEKNPFGSIIETSFNPKNTKSHTDSGIINELFFKTKSNKKKKTEHSENIETSILTTNCSETIWLEKFNLNNGATSDSGSTAWTTQNPSSGRFQVKDNLFVVENTGNNKKGTWTSENINISGKNNVKISVHICSSGGMENSGDNIDFIDLYYKLDGGPEVRFSKNSGSINNNSVDGAIVSVGSLNGNTLKIIIKARTTTSGEIYYFDNVKVTGKGSINASATVDDILNCKNQSVTITGASSASNVTYSWTGPNNFSASTRIINVSEPGDYRLKVTNNQGCKGFATATVKRNIHKPNISASVNGTLSCSVSSVTLSGNSTTPNVVYNWSGPNGFNSTLQNPTVNEAGTYVLQVTNPDSQCISSFLVNVVNADSSENTLWLEKFNLSNGTTSDSESTAWTIQNPSSGGFHVYNNRFKVNNTGKDKSGTWTSESIDISDKGNIKISLNLYSTGDMETNGSGLDFIDIYYKLDNGQKIRFSKNSGSINNNSDSGTTASIGSLNGSSLRIIVESRTTASDEFYFFDNVKVVSISQNSINASATVDDILNCKNQSVTITGASSASNVAYSWTGPNNFSASTRIINVSEPGDYRLKVTNNQGCKGFATATVKRNIHKPNISASVNGTLSCSVSSVTLSGNSTTPNVVYNWSGPNGFNSTLQNPTVNEAGTYVLQVTDPDNQCISSYVVNVVNADNRENILWLEKFNLPNGTTSDTGTTSWSSQNPSSGNLNVLDNQFIVENMGKTKQGIWTSETIDISRKNNVNISLHLASEGTIDSFGELLDYVNVYYKLDGGQKVLFSENLGPINDNDLSGAEVSVGSLSGTSLQIIIKSRTTAFDEFYYIDNVKVSEIYPATIDASASVDGILTCVNESVTITGTSSSNNVNYLWTGPDGFTANTEVIEVNKPGEYTLNVSNSTGCTGHTTVNVIQNIAKPNVSASVNGTLSCSTSEVTLLANSTTPNVTYIWSGPNGFTSTLQNPTVSEAGSYTVLVTDPNNGCSSSFIVNVINSDTTESDIWLEKFNLPDGTTLDTGTTSWTTQNSSSGRFQVKNNIFIVENTGNNKKGIWTSESIDISDKNDVNISVHLCSTGDMESEGSNFDFIDLYYRLDGGQKILFSENLGSINGNNTSGTEVSVGSLKGTSLEIIIKSRTTTTGEIYYFDNVKVTAKNQAVIDASTSVDGVLTCTQNSVTITGESSTDNVTYSWTGPNGFSANTQVINVSEPGEYILTVSNPTGCTGSATATVTQNIFKPELQATASGTITCDVTEVSLTASSTTPEVTFTWEGFTAGENPVTVSSEGEYIVTATNTANGCTSQQTVIVTADTTKPELQATASGTITCDVTEVSLTATSMTSDVTFTWEGFTAGENPITVSSEGEYSVTATNITTGCTSQQTVIVTADTTKPELQATASGTITCDVTEVSLTATSITPDVTFTWEGFTAGENPITVSSEGEYNVTATNSLTGCTSQQTVIVTADTTKPELQATASGTITCDVTEVSLTASSTTPEVNFTWEGFTAGENPITVSSEGEYSVTATNSLTGCTSQQTVIVTADTTKPELQATASGTITCDVTEVSLTATSITPDVTFTWEGFTTGENPITVSSEGEYSVTATNSLTGCTSQQTVIVTADTTKPELQATASGTITCDVTEVSLTASSTTPEVNFTWEGFTAGENPITVSSEGEYSVTATNSLTGCTSQQTVIVTADTTKPELQATASGTITCDVTEVSLTATSITPDVTFTWEGFTAGENPITVSSEGEYSVTATNTVTGCTSQQTVTVKNERTRPDIQTSADGAITCINRQVTLTATSTTPNITFTWEGFTTGENPIEVNYGGQYLVTGTNILTGCSSQKIIFVETERTRPDLDVFSDGAITCINRQVTLTATSTTPNVTFSWDGFPAGENPIEVNYGGQYVVTATNTLNGCTKQKIIEVETERTRPDLQATTDGVISCDKTEVTLTATSMTPNVIFTWEGFTAGENPVEVQFSGQYVVTATNTLNGCTSQQTVMVTADRTKPELQATASGTITCDVTEVSLTATSMTSDVTFTWEGFTAGENPVTVSSEGEYIVTATNTANGCTSQQTVMVTADRTKPELQATASGTITCNVTEVSLTATSMTSDITFTWEGFTAGENPVTVSSEGEYIVTATNTANGCTSQQTVIVTADRTKPELQATASGTITCDVTEVSLTATSITSDVTFTWEGFTAGENPVTVSSEGEYIVTATNTANGCTSQQTVIVTADRTKPELQATASGTITCDVTEVSLTATSMTSDVTFTWEGFTAGENPVTVSSEGEYIVTATNTANGCTSQQTVIVTADRTKPELQATASGTITCDVTEVILTASSITPDVTFSWEGFTAGQNPVNVSSEGEYIVTATNTLNGCTSQQTVLVTADRTKPELQATASGTITCDVTEVSLTATSMTSDVTFTWEGFTVGENPVTVSSEGEYIVTATNTATGCTSQQTVIVTADRTKPELQATASGTITCDVTEVSLTATSMTSDVTFTWEGFTAGENPVTVSSEGEYIVTATNTANGCTSQQTVMVTADRTKPELQATASATITCNVTEVSLTATSMTSDVTFTWEGFTAGENPVTVSSEGEYIVTATNTANGCTSQQTVMVTADRTKPELQATASGTITCNVTEVSLTATSMTSDVTFTWEGFTTGENPVTVSSEGEYIVTATNTANGCTSQQTVMVTADRTKPELQATASGTITCDVTEVSLTATSMTSDVTFTWEGFTAGENPVTVSSEGEYIVTATNTANGCTSQQTVMVTADRTKPELQATASGTITCDVTEVSLTATSMTSDVTFTWEGFTAGENPVIVSSEGEYIVTATNTANGCTSQQTVMVTADRTKPELQATASGTITCDVTEVSLTATSMTSDVTFTWEGFTAGENPVTVSSEGEYIVTATNTANGCTSQQTVIVTADRTKPELQATASGTITCDVTEVSLTATSMTSDVTFTWEGFTAGENPVTVSSEGEYIVTATNTANGCTSQQTVIVTADRTKPELQANASGTITCNVTEVSLTATSMTSDVTFTWEGFTAGENPVTVSSEGEYIVTATNSLTGCTSQQTVIVTADRTKPELQATASGTITCNVTEVSLTATSMTSDVTFTWEGFTAGENPVTVSSEGEYIVTATNTANGCTSQQTVMVTADRTKPELQATASGTITCDVTEVSLTATSMTSDVTFTWEGFTVGKNPVTVSSEGEYIVTATNTANGCTSQQTVMVTADRTKPELQATASGTITCDVTEVSLTATSMTSDVTFTWEGFTAGENPVTVSSEGEYIVTATNTANGCTSQQTVIVTADRTKPELQATASGTITCNVTEVSLTATSMTSDVTFTWEGFTAGENPVTVSSEGEYIVTATNTANGCTSQQTVIVTADRTKPELQATASGTITCDVTEVSLTATSMTSDVTFTWEGFTVGENPVIVSSEGEYIVTATNTANGCTSQQTVMVTADRTKPELQATASGTITCDVTEVSLTATSMTSDVTFTWEGFTAGENPVTVSSEGEYIVTATNTANGCTSQQTVIVTADRTKPELQATASGTITCDVTEVSLTATSMTSDVTFTWEGFTAGENPVTVSSEGEYIVTATNTANGCTSQQTVIVTADRTKPELQANASGTITCNVTEVSLTATSMTSDVTFTWEGFTAGENPVTVSSEGEYIVTATNSLTGCTSQQTVIVTADRTKPELQATASGTITCNVTEVSLTATSMTSDVTFTWEGFTAGENPVTVSSEGEYIVTATNTANGCTSQQTVMVTADRTKPELQATASGTITCDVTEVSLTATSMTSDVTFTWEGFTVGKNPVTVSSEGEYIVTATNTANGCTSQQTVMVTADRTKPELQATASGTITCDVTEVSLTATSMTSDVTFTWEGFTAGENPVTVSSEGEYIVTATNTANGCTSQQTVIVTADRTKPELQATASGTITCNVTEVSLTATSMTSDVTFTWEGFTAGENPVTVSSEGEYIVTATNTANGCTSQQTVIVTADRTKPELQANASGTITCDVTEVSLTATSMTSDVTFTWEGFTVGKNPVTVSSEGEYIVTATNTANGCTSQQTVMVTADRTKPELQATASGTITCDVTEVSLTATSMTSDVTFTWEGFTAGENPVTVSSEGEYIVTATNTANGCTSQQTVIVTADRTKPELQANASGTITCDVTEVSLTATSMTSDVTFTWEGFTAGENPVTVSSEGEYIVTATNTANGCTSQQTVMVTADRTKPELQATASGTITCDVTEVSLTATSMTSDVTFTWEGFTAGENPVTVSSEGEYIVTATNTANGCTSQQTVMVTADRTKPELQATASGTITCDVTEVSLTATSMTSDVTFTWEGFTAGENPVTVSSEGEYIVTATNTANGCTSQQTVIVTADRTKPELQATASGTITCDVTEVSLTATSMTSDVTFTWEGFTAGENPVTVSSEGEYIVTATNSLTGCTSQQTVIVTADRTKPELQATASGTITCDVTEVSLTATSMTSDVTFTWEGFTAGENPVTVSSEGEYIVTATNTATGCTSQQTVIVTADRTKPELQATASGTITCSSPEVSLTATSINPNVTFTWTGFTAGENPVNVSSEGLYIVKATNTITGCTSLKTVLVISTCEQRNIKPQRLPSSTLNTLTQLNSKAYPNPSKDRVTIDFNSMQSGNATIKIYSMTGILTRTISNMKVDAYKKYQVTFNEDGSLPSGVYLYVIQVGKHSFRDRIVLAE